MEINLNPDDLRAEIIEAAAQKIADTYTEGELPDLGMRVEALMAEKIKQHCDDVIVPLIAEGVSSRLIQRTNEYGELKGEPKTFTEYLVESANEYLLAPVDYNGEQSRYSSSKQTRLVWLIDKHLQFKIEEALKKAVAEIEKQIAPAIAETIKLQVDELVPKITKRR